MDDLRNIVEVKELRDATEVNKLISDDWDLLTVSSGVDKEGEPCSLYILGRPYKEPELPGEWL